MQICKANTKLCKAKIWPSHPEVRRVLWTIFLFHHFIYFTKTLRCAFSLVAWYVETASCKGFSIPDGDKIVPFVVLFISP